MRYRHLGKSGLRVSEVSLGSWLTLGKSVDVPTTRVIVRRAFDLGIDLFDTADVYARGAAEEALRQALDGLPRHQLVLATKAFFPMSERPNDRGLSRKHLVESVEGSLRRLGTDYLDLHQCHRADPATPLDETVRAYEDLIRQGKVLYWGTSEWKAEEIERACLVADGHGAYRPVSNQPQYSILARRIERDVIPVCQREGLGQIVFSPLAQGVLTGKYAGALRPEGTRAADPENGAFMQRFLDPDTLARVERLRPVAADAGLSLAGLALAFCLREENVASVIVGATRAEHVDENVRASGITLSPETVAAVNAVFPARA
ncbi:MAG: aldo/keto reductase family protein [Deltaproteobacteria bacterium]|nr:aldo/keto reductase family protein [Deltaproteobacteria bacterium]